MFFTSIERWRSCCHPYPTYHISFLRSLRGKSTPTRKNKTGYYSIGNKIHYLHMGCCRKHWTLKIKQGKITISVVHSFWSLCRARQYHCRVLCIISKRLGNCKINQKAWQWATIKLSHETLVDLYVSLAILSFISPACRIHIKHIDGTVSTKLGSLIQWHLYTMIIELTGLSRQVVFQNRVG